MEAAAVRGDVVGEAMEMREEKWKEEKRGENRRAKTKGGQGKRMEKWKEEERRGESKGDKRRTEQEEREA